MNLWQKIKLKLQEAQQQCLMCQVLSAEQGKPLAPSHCHVASEALRLLPLAAQCNFSAMLQKLLNRDKTENISRKSFFFIFTLEHFYWREWNKCNFLQFYRFSVKIWTNWHLLWFISVLCLCPWRLMFQWQSSYSSSVCAYLFLSVWLSSCWTLYSCNTQFLTISQNTLFFHAAGQWESLRSFNQ